MDGRICEVEIDLGLMKSPCER